MKNYRGVRKWLNAVLVLGVAGMLTFAGCTEVDDTLGYELVPGNQQMEMRLHSIRKGFEARMFMSDSVKSSNLSYGYFGTTKSDTFGIRKAGFMTQYLWASISDRKNWYGYRPIFDSLQLLLSVSSYAGDTLQPQRFGVYRILNNDYLKDNDGNGDGTFAPNRPTSTGEMLKLVLLSTGHKEQKPSTAHWASGYATYAYSMGFAAQNYSDYQLDNGISRLDVARFAAKALGYGASNTTSPFADVNDGYVTALYEAGVFIGTKVGDLTYFYPNSSITRAEVATIVYRIYQLSSLDQKQKIYYKDYTLDVLEGVPTNTYNQSAFVKNGSIMTYNDPSVRTRVGIDVSQYQGDVDWNAVARTDVDFVIARVGGRGYTVGAIYDDTKFDEYADGAARAGLQVGAYFFSQAVSVAEAQEEAYHVLDKLRGHEITGPVVFDWEVIGKREARTYGIETGVLCAAANAFCKIIKDAGYDPMIYITDYAGYVKYDLSEVMDYPLWYARYDVDAPSFYYDFAMWQYSSKGSVDGIKGNVDMDIWFIK